MCLYAKQKNGDKSIVLSQEIETSESKKGSLLCIYWFILSYSRVNRLEVWNVLHKCGLKYCWMH